MDNYHLNEDYKKKYETIEKIGLGNFTEVYKAEKKDTKELRALKIIKLDDIKLSLKNLKLEEEINKEINEEINDLKNEIKNMIKCGENNINSVKYYESFETENEFVIVLELCVKRI